jgi:hypothetical protein
MVDAGSTVLPEEQEDRTMQFIWRILGQQPDLADLERRPTSPGVERGPGPRDRRDHYERVVAREAPGEPLPDGPFRSLVREVMAYRIFPVWLVEGVLRREPMQSGDTYGICYHFLPGLDLFFGGRVTETFDGPMGTVWRAGFSLRTVEGHAELGEETFQVQKDLLTGEVRVAITSWSRPGHWLAKLAAPWVRWTQVRACRLALDELERKAGLGSAGSPGP